MSDLATLLSQYSLESIIIFIFLLIVVFKFGYDLISWLHKTLKHHFHKEEQNEKNNISLHENIKLIDSKIDNIYKTLEDTEKNRKAEQIELNNKLSLIEERLQENTRSFLIDSHHKFCYEIGAIDDINLQSIERRYVYYKNAGGDSFIDNLILEIRQLPKVNLENLQSIERREGIDDN